MTLDTFAPTLVLLALSYCLRWSASAKLLLCLYPAVWACKKRFVLQFLSCETHCMAKELTLCYGSSQDSGKHVQSCSSPLFPPSILPFRIAPCPAVPPALMPICRRNMIAGMSLHPEF